MTFIQKSSRRYGRDEARDGKQHVERKGQIPNDRHISIQLHARVATQTRINARQNSVMQQPSRVCAMQQTGRRQKNGKKYKNITCYKCVQLGHYSGLCPFKEDKQEKNKEKGSDTQKIVQGVNRVATGISSMHVDH